MPKLFQTAEMLREAFRERATKPSADGAPARRPPCVSDLRVSMQSRTRAYFLPLCGELEECAGARDIPEGGGGEGGKKDLEDFFFEKEESVSEKG